VDGRSQVLKPGDRLLKVSRKAASAVKSPRPLKLVRIEFGNVLNSSGTHLDNQVRLWAYITPAPVPILAFQRLAREL